MLLRFVRFIANIREHLSRLDSIPQMQDELDALRSRLDVPVELLADFERDRKTSEYLRVYERPEPLVSVCVGTYNRAELVVNRCIRSVLDQDYTNLELIVVGDCCTDHTAEKIAGINDPRLTFINLPERGRYPENPSWRWMVAGTATVNHALKMARGDFITHLDDDDRYASDRLSRLVRFAQEQRADLVWHPFWAETPTGKWRRNDALRLANGHVTTSAIFYHRWLCRIPWDIEAYRYSEPGDFNRLRKLKYLGIHACRYPDPLLWHYKERSQAK